MVVVPNELIKEEAQEEFGKGRVFTVHEAKGLEAAFVILWRFFSDEAGIWKHPHRSADPSSRDWKQRARYQVSLFTVAVTRAREQLFIIDEEVPKDWGPLSQTEFEEDSLAQSRLTAVLEIQSQSEDYLRLAKELEDRELYEQAAANYFEARHEKEAYRCQGIFAERNGKFGRAARMYEQAERYGDAARCYERVEHYQKAFELTLETDGGEGLPQVHDYLQEDRKLAKLDGDVSSAILKAIHDEHPDVTVATLFQYSSRRVGWHRYELGRTVDEVDTVSVRDVKEGGKQLQRTLTQLRMKN
jgi:ATP-dependent exoDNAse (exonuclease V) beta subunit